MRTVFVVLTLVEALTACRVFQSPEEHTIEYFEYHYGVDREAVLEVAEVYGVSPESFSAYGDSPFPINYVKSELGWEQPTRLTVHRSDINAVVRGYTTRCEVSDTQTLYLFYSDWLSPKTRSHGEALVMSVSYELDVARAGVRDDQEVREITYYNVGDSGGLVWERVAPQCVPPARHENVEGK
jgi:hypothetical protein